MVTSKLAHVADTGTRPQNEVHVLLPCLPDSGTCGIRTLLVEINPFQNLRKCISGARYQMVSDVQRGGKCLYS